MTVDELIHLSDSYEPTDAEISDLNKRLQAAEVIFLKEREDRQITEHWLGIEYTI